MSDSAYSKRTAAQRWLMTLVFLLVSASAGWSWAQTAAGPSVRVIDGEALRDPTRPVDAFLSTRPPGQGGGGAGGAAAQEYRYRVSFIRAGGSRPMAVINEQPVQVGEQVGGARVLSIEAGAVTLEVDGERRVVSTWQESSVRQPASGGATDVEPMNTERETDN